MTNRDALYEKARAIAEGASNRWDKFGDTAGVQWLADQIVAVTQAGDLGAPDQWHDITTAPKDGREVDLYKVGRHTGYYWDREQRGGGAWSSVHDRQREWRDRRTIIAPTHWMSRPADPANPEVPSAGEVQP